MRLLAVALLAPALAWAADVKPCVSNPGDTVTCTRAGFDKLVNATLDARAEAAKATAELEGLRQSVSDRDAALARVVAQVASADRRAARIQTVAFATTSVAALSGVALGLSAMPDLNAEARISLFLGGLVGAAASLTVVYLQ